MAIYSIESEFQSPATKIILARENFTNRPVCLKIWLPCENGVYSTSSKQKRINFLLEGLTFNKQFAPNVYWGVALVRMRFPWRQKIWCGPIISQPDRNKLSDRREYALVMERLDYNWRMDNWLIQGQEDIKSRLEFVAGGIAEMHLHRFVEEPQASLFGTPESITKKLESNSTLFEEVLDRLQLTQIDTRPYLSIVATIKHAFTKFASYFKLRYEQGHIKRCHGDLKLSNLWIRPPYDRMGQALLALDCVDFNDEFCHIDTLSDIAMLVVDLEVFLHKRLGFDANMLHSPLIQHFLNTYLLAAKEVSNITHVILAFYLTEKSLVHAFMHILYDHKIDVERCRILLDNALIHGEYLKTLLPYSWIL